MSKRHSIRVHPLPAWIDPHRLLGPHALRVSADATGWQRAELELPAAEAADLQARLHNVGLAGRAIAVEIDPPLGRSDVRRARTEEARRRRARSPGFTRSGTQLDAEARWSLTPEALALALGKRAAGLSVIDAGCGAGGNAIGFARAGCTVTAIEGDAQRLRMARHNAALYRVERRITFVHGDARELVPSLRADLLFVDPPWGRSYDKTRLSLAEMPLLELMLAQRGRFARLWAKVPPSFDPSEIPGARPEAWFGAGSGDARRVKFVLIVLGE
jgi:RNA cap guanine-N2 methyltransferase